MIDVKKIAGQAGIKTDAWECGSGSLLYVDDVHGIPRSNVEAFVSLILEAAAVECENRQDHDEESKANKRFREADKTGDIEDAVARGNYWMTVSTCNAVIRNCATAIRAMKPGKEQT